MCACVFSLSICISIISLVKFFHAEFHSPYLCMHLYVVKTIHRHTYVHTLFLFIFKISPLEAWILKSFASGESVFGTKTFTCPISTCQSWGWCNNEMSSCPLINWNEENVMFWWENQDRSLLALSSSVRWVFSIFQCLGNILRINEIRYRKFLLWKKAVQLSVNREQRRIQFQRLLFTSLISVCHYRYTFVSHGQAVVTSKKIIIVVTNGNDLCLWLRHVFANLHFGHGKQ